MTEQDSIETELLEFVGDELLHGESEGLDCTTPLLEWGILDSLKVLTLIDFVERKYAIELDHGSLRPEHLANISAIGKHVSQRIAEQVKPVVHV